MSKDKKIIKKETIIKAAEKLFGKRGYKGVSVDDIVAKAGIAKGTFYLYFKSKDELYAFIVDSYRCKGAERMKEVMMQEPRVKVRLLRSFMGRLKFIGMKPILQGIFLDNPDYYSPTITPDRIFEINKKMTEEVIQGEGGFRDGADAEFIAGVNWLFSTLVRYKDEHCGNDPEKTFWTQAELFAKVIIDGLFTKDDWPEVDWQTKWKELEKFMKKK